MPSGAAALRGAGRGAQGSGRTEWVRLVPSAGHCDAGPTPEHARSVVQIFFRSARMIFSFVREGAGVGGRRGAARSSSRARHFM